MKLYELAGNYQLLLERAEEVEDLVSLTGTLEAIQDGIEEKAENIVRLIRNWDSDVNAIREEEKRLAEKRRSLESKTSHLKDYLHYHLDLVGMDKIKRPTFTLSIQTNPPSVDVTDETLIPLHFMIPQPNKIDKKAIAAYLKDGLVVPGVSLIQKKSIRIK